MRSRLSLTAASANPTRCTPIPCITSTSTVTREASMPSHRALNTSVNIKVVVWCDDKYAKAKIQNSQIQKFRTEFVKIEENQSIIVRIALSTMLRISSRRLSGFTFSSTGEAKAIIWSSFASRRDMPLLRI